MKKVIVLLMLASCLTATAAPSKVYMNHEMKRLTQKQAIVLLAGNPGAVVYAMTELELSEKGTLRVKKATK